MDLFVQTALARPRPINFSKINSNVKTVVNKLPSLPVLFLIKQEPR